MKKQYLLAINKEEIAFIPGRAISSERVKTVTGSEKVPYTVPYIACTVTENS